MSDRKFDSFKYEKSIKLSGATVWARVNRLDKETGELLTQVDFNYFSGMFNSRQKRFNKAHKWADELIKSCVKNETGSEYYASLKDIEKEVRDG